MFDLKPNDVIKYGKLSYKVISCSVNEKGEIFITVVPLPAIQEIEITSSNLE